MRGAFYRVNETVRVRCPARRSRPREWLSLSSPLTSPHRGHHSGFSLGRIGARNMPDDQGCAPGRGCSLGARSGTMPGVVGRNGARCQRRRLPGLPLVVVGGAAHATAHATAHAPWRSRPHRPLRRVSSTCRARGECLRLSLSGQRCCRGSSPQRPLPAPESPVLGAGACIPTWPQWAAAGADPAFVARAAVGRLCRQRR